MANNNHPHLFLLNPRGISKSFDASRPFKPSPPPPKAASAYTAQKVLLDDSLKAFNLKRKERIQKRSIDVPFHLEFIKIHFFVVFNNNDAFKNKTTFARDFGLVPVRYEDFNQTVIFAINDQEKFKDFICKIESFINSHNTLHPSGTDYAIVTIIKELEFLTTESIVGNAASGDVIISVADELEEIKTPYKGILIELLNHLELLKVSEGIKNFSTIENNIIQINDISKSIVNQLADNFDIIIKIQSIRVPEIKRNEYNQPELTWGIEIDPPLDQIKIGILDNGVKKIKPLENIIIDYGFDITSSTPNPLIANSPHGTAVASLAALGIDYFDTTKKKFKADAYIVPIKILNFSEGSFNPRDIENIVKEAYKQGIRIFNLSVCGPSKNYNTDVSEYAFLLDKLAFENDLLIFTAVGNLSPDDIEAMSQDDDHDGLHDYPNHFYNPNKMSSSHVCECINLCIPSESMNNITIGATAENFVDAEQPHLTPFKELPAYYSRKYHIDYLKRINGTFFSESQKNWNITKPDIVMPGGDVLESSAGMRLIGFGETGNDFYFNDCGTSLATPLATNLAAKLLKLYPKLNMQSIKSLIINSSALPLSDEFLSSIVNSIRNEEAQNQFGVLFAALDKSQKRQISTNISNEHLYQRLVGFGKPDIDKLLYSSSKHVTLVVQDSISINSYKAISVNIPEYLLQYSGTSYILKLKATLCYKFRPKFNNQLDYNPLHISFNFARSIEKDDPKKLAEVASNRNDSFYDQFYEPDFDDKQKLKARSKALGIKSNLESWSEDFFPRTNKPFSNVQKMELNINKKEIEKASNQIGLIIRSTGKVDVDKETENWLQSAPHEFSIAITISEKENAELSNESLYDELINCNDLEAISTIIVEADADQDLDLDVSL